MYTQLCYHSIEHFMPRQTPRPHLYIYIYIWKTASRVVIEVGNLGCLARDISPNGKKSLLVLIYSKLHSKSYDYLYKDQGPLVQALKPTRFLWQLTLVSANHASSNSDAVMTHQADQGISSDSLKHIVYRRKYLGFIFEKNKRKKYLESISSLFSENRVQAKEVSVMTDKIMITCKKGKKFFFFFNDWLSA